MARAIKAKPKKRGRPAIGKDPLVGVRFPPSLIETVDAWAAMAGDDGVTRSETIRQLVEAGLKALSTPKGRK
jgi:metal-responsive CopG/Arc/MetJ family transcriptional regulator